MLVFFKKNGGIDVKKKSALDQVKKMLDATEIRLQKIENTSKNGTPIFKDDEGRIYFTDEHGHVHYWGKKAWEDAKENRLKKKANRM
jgi:hypothetical protein